MRIAILGATSQIARDLIQSIYGDQTFELMLYARRPEVVTHWLHAVGLGARYPVANFTAFNIDEKFDAVCNFVGVGDPAQAAAMGGSIYDITLQYDEMALKYIQHHPQCKYLFLSSGAAYGSNFDKPVTQDCKAVIEINNLQPQDWYAVAKLHAECRHRSLAPLPIIDIRVFNYFSQTQDMSARFLITDMVRSIRDRILLKTSSDYIVRDFLHPSDFYRLVQALLVSEPRNAVVDCYSLAPTDKPTLLEAMQKEFGLQYEIIEGTVGINATGRKPYYYSLNRLAAEFGYKPSLTSLEGVIRESRIYLQNH